MLWQKKELPLFCCNLRITQPSVLSPYSLPFDLRDLGSEVCRQYRSCMQWAYNTAAALSWLITLKANVGSIRMDTGNCGSFHHHEPGEHVLYVLFPNSAPRTPWNNVDRCIPLWLYRGSTHWLFLCLLMILIFIMHWTRWHDVTHHNLLPLLCLFFSPINNI